MGGLPVKPKLQGYITEELFDKFEVYHDSHYLNQSRGLEKLLSEFFGKQSKNVPEKVGNQDEDLRAELIEFKTEVEKRLLALEAKLSVSLASELATESAVTVLNGLAASLAIESALIMDETVIEAVNGLAITSANESAYTEDTTVLAESAGSAANLEIESAEVEESAAPLDELAEVSADESVDEIAELINRPLA